MPIVFNQQEQEKESAKIIQAKISHYYPPLGGVNCSNFVGGKCVSRMASGLAWENWVGRACACPPEFPFGTRFVVLGKEWVCLDRGGKIIIENGVVWLDLLTPEAEVPFGTLLEVELLSN